MLRILTKLPVILTYSIFLFLPASSRLKFVTYIERRRPGGLGAGPQCISIIVVGG